MPDCNDTATAVQCRPVTQVVPALAAGDKLVQLVYEALDAATQTETAHQEELAAKRALEKAHVKVSRRQPTLAIQLVSNGSHGMNSLLPSARWTRRRSK